MALQQAARSKWLQWEFWPYPVFYLPVYFLVLAHALRLRSLAYFTAVNPGVPLGGFVSYSKSALLHQLPREQVPATLCLNEPKTADQILALMKQHSLQFPVVLKPDQGERGWKVEKISNTSQLEAYLRRAPWPLLVQQFAEGPEEFGVMYIRYPGEQNGRITSLMQRQFLSVTGDGQSTLEELLRRHERCLHYLPRMLRRHRSELQQVLPAGERKILEEIGNHNRGTMFLDISHRISPQLAATFDRLSAHLHEWYFGRFDVRAASFQDLEAGRFQVVEVNGVNSEPAHIYDPAMSLWRAYSHLFQHWTHIYRIARHNRQRGWKPASARFTWLQIRRHLREKKINPNN
ncbi:MAG: hypothetical protein RMK52_06990 [Chitinophagales bacterium]|nr:hypothetical protein [Chitinophagales bacterium]MDW8393975.1 hypothetical protein [Chitinophagales bacterium]